MSQSVRDDAPDALPALLSYIAQVRDRTLDEIRTQADAESRVLLASARHKARERVVQAIRDQRRDADVQVRQALAASQARVRSARQALTAGALEQVWARIDQGLRKAWHDGASRRSWIAMAIAEAVRSLPAGAWQLSGPAHWDPQESRDALARLAADRQGVTVDVRLLAEIDAGLRIQCGAAVLDASAAGLLRARDEVAGRWLGELSLALDRQRPARTGT